VYTFLFYPSLTNPSKEHSINEGRKRIDILYDNTATGGFFDRMAKAPDTNAKTVIIECKNYSNNIANPELDQLIGRFSIHSGKFGIISCRHDDNPDLTLQRCKDALNAGQGTILVLTDQDLIKMLENYDDFYSASHIKILDTKLRSLIT